MKTIIAAILTICLITGSLAQPNGNGHGNGNGGNGNNGNGNGGCGNPPCGGPNSVPIETEWLLFAGLIMGYCIKLARNKKN
jgi:hypothetical protein